jgi:hypothetical protein
MNEESGRIYERAMQGSEKFDYFVCGAAGTLFAYIAQTYVPKKLGWNPATLEPLSILFLAACFFCGLRRIQLVNGLIQLNHIGLKAAEEASELAVALGKGPGPYRSSVSGAIFDRATAEAKKQEYLNEAQRIELFYDEIERRPQRYFQWRNGFLMLAFLTIFLSKLLQPYVVDSPPPAVANSPKTNTAPKQTPLPGQANTPAAPVPQIP